MTESNEDRREVARRKAQNHFTSSEQREASLRQEIEKERSRTAAKTARLRELRLAKEKADQQVANEAADAPQKKTSRQRRAKNTRVVSP